MSKHNLNHISENTGIIVKPAKTEDIQNILSAQNATFPKDPANLSVTEFAQAIKDEKQVILTAKLEGQFVGYIALHDRNFRPWTNLNNLIILPNYCRRGYASYLLLQAMKQMKRPLIRLFVEKKNKNAITLYEKIGFKHISTKTEHYENGDDAFIMIAENNSSLNPSNNEFEQSILQLITTIIGRKLFKL